MNLPDLGRHLVIALVLAASAAACGPRVQIRDNPDNPNTFRVTTWGGLRHIVRYADLRDEAVRQANARCAPRPARTLAKLACDAPGQRHCFSAEFTCKPGP